MIVEILFEEKDPRLIIGGLGTMILGIYLISKNLWIELGEKIPLGGLVILIGFVILIVGLNADLRGMKTKKIKKNLDKKTILWIIVIVFLFLGINVILDFFGN